MFGIGILEFGLFVLLFSALVAILLYRVTRSLVLAFGGSATATGDVPWQRVLGVRLLGMLAGAVLGVLTFQLGLDGRGPMLALAVFGLCVLAATAVGETAVKPLRPPGVRSASLSARRVRDYLPWTTPLVAFLVLVTVAVLTLTTVVASDDDLGRSRAIACATSGAGAVHTPFPGSFYSVPLAVALVVVLGTAVLACRSVVDRPRGMAADAEEDDRRRRNSLDMVMAATGTAVAAPLFGVAFAGGAGFSYLSTDIAGCAPGWYGETAVALFLVALIALWSTSLFLGRLVLVKAPGRP